MERTEVAIDTACEKCGVSYCSEYGECPLCEELLRMAIEHYKNKKKEKPRRNRMKMYLVEYVWLDGCKTQKLRAKQRIVNEGNYIDTYPEELKNVETSGVPVWGFDGSSTEQNLDGDADSTVKKWVDGKFVDDNTTKVTDKKLVPVRVIENPQAGYMNGIDGLPLIAFCEVYEGDKPHATNTRARLRKLVEETAHLDPWFGFEQEYSLMEGGMAGKWVGGQDSKPLGWTNTRGPEEQGPFYCGVGADEIKGDKIVDTHTQYCIESGLLWCGMNAEVMPSQWEYQIGYRGRTDDEVSPLDVADDLWLARFLMLCVARRWNVHVELNPKIFNHLNGAGLHTNFSINHMRADDGYPHIEKVIELFAKNHDEHMKENIYGHGMKDRLSGELETSHWGEFTYAVGGRTGCSVRIPEHVHVAGKGYIEDRRPCSNANPYNVCSRILETVKEAYPKV